LAAAPLEGGLSTSIKQSDPLLFGKVQTEAMFNLQKELLDGYAEASRAWSAQIFF
jgi:hypothetical protein